jgi:hypothetical protein
MALLDFLSSATGTNAADVPGEEPQPGFFSRLYRGAANVASGAWSIGAKAFNAVAHPLSTVEQISETLGRSAGNIVGAATREAGAGVGSGLTAVVFPLLMVLAVVGVALVLIARTGAVRVRASV